MKENIIRNSIRFMISSTIIAAENSNEDKEELINIQFNMFNNLLQPEYALIFNEELMKMSKQIKIWQSLERQDLVDEITNNMKEI